MKRLDYSVLLGWSIGLGAILTAAYFEGIRLTFLWQPTAALIVFGGTFGAVIARRGLRGLRQAIQATWAYCFRTDGDELEAAMARLTWLARVARREGVRTFEAQAKASNDVLIKQALTLIADYVDPSDVRARLNSLLVEEEEQGLNEVSTLDSAGGYAPTFGIIGAVLGLIFVLRSLADPASLGMGISTAFVATIYGVGAANLIFFPLAARLRDRHRAHMKRRAALADALVALAARESPSAIAARGGGQ